MSINIKKYTKEQMAGMVDAAQAANAELERQVAVLGDRLEKQEAMLSEYANKNTNLRAEISSLRNKLRDTEASLGRVNAELSFKCTEVNALSINLHRSEDFAKELHGTLKNKETALKWAKEHPWKHLWECLKGAKA